MSISKTTTDGPFRLERRPTAPGAMLREMFLRPRRVSIARFAATVGCSRKHLSDIVNGRARLDAFLAARVARVLGTSTRLWVNLQAGVDAWDADQAARDWHPPTLYLPPAAE